MSTRTVTILTCDSCESQADPHDWDETVAWMETHGWKTVGERELCPACLMDQDAASRTDDEIQGGCGGNSLETWCGECTDCLEGLDQWRQDNGIEDE